MKNMFDFILAAVFFAGCFILSAIFAVLIYPIILVDKIMTRKNLSRTPQFEQDNYVRR
tara:strand:+ start:603 stop:776 length:174 start_codon:yes stop_codon:yes gene_type:complete